MSRKRPTETERIEHEIESALNPGTFIPDRASFSFVTDLDKIAAKIAELIGNDPAQAISLYETFLAACYVKIEELDDSSGSFGQFVCDLYCGWVRARQKDGADADETASRLILWMDQDDYGLSHSLEVDVAKVLDKANLGAFVNQIRARFDAAGGEAANEESSALGRPDYTRRRWGGALRTLYAAQKDVAACIALAEETGLTASDCHTIGKLFMTKRKPEDALAWVDRGIKLDNARPGSSAGYDLSRLKRNLLLKLGRDTEALEAAWADYREHPSHYTYNDLMKYVPKADRAKWRTKALDATKDAHLSSVMDLLLALKEWGRLADLIRDTNDGKLQTLSHYTTESVAEKLSKPHPDLAARLWRAQGLRIVTAKKSKYYDAALSNFDRAKRCFERAGLEAEWRKTVAQVRADHSRKSSFMPGFERLVAGAEPSGERSFLEQAKARWSSREPRSR